MIYQISIEEARACLGDLVTLVAWTGDKVLITRQGIPRVMLSGLQHATNGEPTRTLTRKLVKEMSRAPEVR